MTSLIFIYNANGNLLSDISGAFKKVIGVKGNCSLCMATYGVVKEKKAWKEYLTTLEEPPTYYHKDDVPKDIEDFLASRKEYLPVILKKGVKGYEVHISQKELDDCGSSDCRLIELLKYRDED